MPPSPWDWDNNRGPGNRNNNRSNNENFSAPRSAPPAQAPQRPNQAFGGPGVRSVSPGSIRNCVGRFTYIWLSNGQEFWFFPIQVWGDSIAGFRWDRRFGWNYTGISLNRIDMFTCTR